MKPLMNVINVSGGKDSTATLLLAKERLAPDEMIAVFADTGNEHEITLQYIQYLSENVFPIKTIKADFSRRIETRVKNIRELWGKEGISDKRISQVIDNLKPTGIPFLDLCILKGRFPGNITKFCTVELKVKPVQNQIVKPLLEGYDEVRQWLGIRWNESHSRANAVEFEEDQDIDGLTYYRPILNWTAEDTFIMHKKYSVEPNPLYLQGMGRVGCMPCIMCPKEELFQIFKRFPQVKERLKAWEEIVALTSKRGDGTFFCITKTPGPGKGIEDVYKWAMTSRGGQQYSLRSLTPVKKCSSHYGLCE